MRTKRDKEYYDSARNLQKQQRLPDHCSVQEFQKKALSFIVHINPYLAQPYSNQDAAEYVVDLMPECLDTDGRILKKSLLNKRKELVLLEVMRECSKIVFESQKNSSETNMLTHEETLSFPTYLDELSDLAGVTMVANDIKQFCTRCPHTNNQGITKPCWRNPLFAGPLPIPIHINDERRKEIESDRASNSKKFKLQLVPLQAPRRDKIQEYQKKRSEKKEAKKEGIPSQPAASSSATLAAPPLSISGIE